MGGVGNDGGAASEVTGEAFSDGKEDIRRESQPECSLGALTIAMMVVVVRVASPIPP